MASILTPLQAAVLDAIGPADFMSRRFFLSGGTALSEFYLHHRYSDDLDFFTRDPDVALDVEARELRGVLVESGFEATHPTSQRDYSVFFVGRPGAPADLKIDLVRDVAVFIEPVVPRSPFPVDSFVDIAVNKVLALADRLEPKDAADVYFLLTNTRWTLPYLMELSTRKDNRLEEGWGKLELATRLLHVDPDGLLSKVRFTGPVDVQAIVDRLRAEGREIMERLRPAGP